MAIMQSPPERDPTPAAGQLLEQVPDGGAVVLFDGVCNFCDWSVQFICDHDDGTLRFAPLQSPAGRTLLEAHGFDPGYFDSLVYISTHGTFRKSDAVARIGRHLSWPWRGIWYARGLPRPVRDVAYDGFADVRYGLFGQKDQCMRPDAQRRARFLQSSAERATGDQTA